MIKTVYSTMLVVIGFLALMLMLPSGHLMAQTVVELSVTSSTNATSFTTEAQAADEHYCVHHCREHYEQRLRECSEPGHEHHKRCEEWAREREKECLDKCYHEYPR